MNVSLSPQLDGYVRSLVQTGDYSSASEVVREGLRLLKLKQERDHKLSELRGLIQESLESGPAVSMAREDMKAEMRKRGAVLRAEVDRGERPAPGGPSSITA